MSSSSSTRRLSHPQVRQGTRGAYRLVRTPPVRVAPPHLDAAQRAVVDHAAGPLLVLAGPGTGKTTTLVESVAARIARGGDPERILVLTFSRKAAVELRDRMALRIGAARAPQATTFHSFCYALVRAHQDSDLFVEPLRLLSGPEQDVTVRELLAGQPDLERLGLAHVRWPDELRACLTTRGFADEVRAVLARSRELGLGPHALDAFARRLGRPDWRAAAAFLAEYLDVLDLQGVLDYAELVHRAVLLARRPETAERLAAQYDAVYVDEYQDTDPAQVRLLRALAGGGRTLVAFGDPDQSIYAFRGADVNGILEFPQAFPRADGRPAPVEVLRTSRRSGAALLAATRLLTQRMPLTRLPAEKVRAHRELAPVREGGRVEVFTYPTPGTELDNIADILRRAHLEDGVPWGEMAVLVRAGARMIPTMRRALTAAGVPLDIDGDDLPLRHEPAVAPLLTALRAVANAEAAAREVPSEEADAAAREVPSGEAEAAAREVPSGEAEAAAREVPSGEAEAAAREVPSGEADAAAREVPSGEADAAAREVPSGEAEGTAREVPSEEEAAQEVVPSAEAEGAGAVPDEPEPDTCWLDTETALTLLTFPLAGMDTADLRRLGRALRDEERAAGNPLPPPSDELLARALAEPERLAVHDPTYARGAQRLGALLRKARERLAGGGTAEEALWDLWEGTPWPARLERTARRGGAAGRNADRDLDAVCALFATAARAEERTGGRGALNFLAEIEAEDIAADTLTRRAVRPDAVRLMTAHRSKGLEWRLVVVAGVQEGLWPDLRRRGSLLEADRIGRDGLAEPLTPGALLAEERRLFYVAATRARERLVVTAVKAPADDGDQPSRFLTELGVEPRDVTGRPRRPLSVAALVAELRATTVDPRASDALREAAARRLARLAALTDEDGRPLVPSAHPYRWWGMFEPTESKVPLRDRDQPVVLSGSALDQLANTCALQWFLGREVKADAPATAAQGFGNVVHVLADEVASGHTPADLAVLMERLDSVWNARAFDAPWKSAQEKDHARVALERFLKWHVMDRAGRTPVASEHDFDVTLAAGEFEVRIRGQMDRVEADADGRAYVVDFKTGKQAPSAAEVARHPQLAVYQLAVREGAVDEAFDGVRPEPGGAELVQLRQGAAKRDGGETLPKVQGQAPLEGAEGEWVGDLLATAAGKVLDERFTPTAGQHCTHCAFRASCSARSEGRHVVE
ncbi:UvrD-helicase domain-containing protein [Streptomyces sp. ISL-22]|uniref:UvrD-helicase domain-containing protein n=1 Tax=unclassified Streptomyces TaxID=2593676 RepID=UPI001BEB7A46|nr:MULTISPECIES: UvrD-helicase domain-containing protein [unclassified Streptomyces]MBT2423669.1 UvrD-helicase domain-containing protein [Streptomyces sp. ISL-24]MBT2436239.1 UvrD-helicase domain-containing protein [Streptomyces sp. ISL-22]